MEAANRLNEDGLVLSGCYAETMEEIVRPGLKACRTDEMVKGFEDRPLFVSRFDAEAPRGTVMIVHGFTESVEKYSEVIYSLLRNHWSVLAYDQRGHGRSWRSEKTGEDASLTHVDHFEEYEKDLEILCDGLLRGMPQPWMLFSHSMGGAVSGLFLESRGDVFERAVFCAPMIAPRRNGIPLPAAKALCDTERKLGRGAKRMLGSKPYDGPERFEESAASGKERFDWYDAVKASTKAFQNNGPSYSWVGEALRVTEQLLREGGPESIRIPVRVYGAEQDGSVLQEEQILFAERLPNGQREVVPGSRHEIYRSPDAVLFPWWHRILAFYGGEA